MQPGNGVGLPEGLRLSLPLRELLGRPQGVLGLMSSPPVRYVPALEEVRAAFDEAIRTNNRLPMRRLLPLMEASDDE